jgi:CRISPR/Cas system-associated exonuclease Cas4 (RecB family)
VQLPEAPEPVRAQKPLLLKVPVLLEVRGWTFPPGVRGVPAVSVSMTVTVHDEELSRDTGVSHVRVVTAARPLTVILNGELLLPLCVGSPP